MRNVLSAARNAGAHDQTKRRGTRWIGAGSEGAAIQTADALYRTCEAHAQAPGWAAFVRATGADALKLTPDAATVQLLATYTSENLRITRTDAGALFVHERAF